MSTISPNPIRFLDISYLRHRIVLCTLLVGGMSPILLGLSSCTTQSNLYADISPEGQPSGNQAQVGLHYFLPRGKIRMTGSYQKSGDESSFKITTERLIEPYREERCFFKYRSSVLYDDEFTLEIDDNGLLKTVNSTSTDQTPAIIESMTEIAVNLFKISAELGITGKLEKKPRPFVYTFDPLDKKQADAAEEFLRDMGITLTIDCRKIADLGKGKDLGSKTVSSTKTDGVFYHPPVAVTLNFSIGKAAAPDTKDSVVYTLPDYRFIECVSLRRATLVKQDTQLTFSKGMLNHVKFTRPSQALAAVQIPQKIVSKAAEAVPAIIKIQSEAATRDIKDQTAQLKAQRDYLQAQIDLQKKQAELNNLLPKNSPQKKEAFQNPTDQESSPTEAEPSPAFSATPN